ncbi:hypothetical protein ABG768_013287 [Culter alburnus]|uniref:Uncharacterized protein n=1 Tax=Culter alburnus TaxID=194366 RepID=A0AAW2B505_CULAL
MAGFLECQNDVAQHMRRPQTEGSQKKEAISQDQDSLLMFQGQAGGVLMFQGQAGGVLMFQDQGGGGLMFQGQGGGGLMFQGQGGGGLMFQGQGGGGLMFQDSTLNSKAWLTHMHLCLQGSLPRPQAPGWPKLSLPLQSEEEQS